MKYLCIIQARLGSTRFPNKVMQLVGGISILKRVWMAAKECKEIDHVVVAWPERYPDVDENDVLERFRRLNNEFLPDFIIRLTSDCPLITTKDIKNAIQASKNKIYYSNHLDGRDVQIFRSWLIRANAYDLDRQHVIADFKTKKHKYGIRSVDSREDLEYVRKLNNAR